MNGNRIFSNRKIQTICSRKFAENQNSLITALLKIKILLRLNNFLKILIFHIFSTKVFYQLSKRVTKPTIATFKEISILSNALIYRKIQNFKNTGYSIVKT